MAIYFEKCFILQTDSITPEKPIYAQSTGHTAWLYESPPNKHLHEETVSKFPADNTWSTVHAISDQTYQVYRMLGLLIQLEKESRVYRGTELQQMFIMYLI